MAHDGVAHDGVREDEALCQVTVMLFREQLGARTHARVSPRRVCY